MSTHTAEISWERHASPFTDNCYSRAHAWRFDGGAVRGETQKNDEGKDAITCVTLQPAVDFSGAKVPTGTIVQQLHHEAHESCFLANSIKTQILIQGSWRREA